jgi:AGZA family xanthine/uracil permease-like MFS transporter
MKPKPFRLSTGIAAVVTGVLLLACLVLSPVLTYVPVQATTGALIFVAIKMVSAVRPARTDALAIVVVAVTIAVTVITLTIDQAMAAAFIVCVGADIVRRRRPHPVLLVATALLIASTVLQMINK